MAINQATSLSVREVNNIALGSLGFKVVSNATIQAEENTFFFALLIDTDATFSAMSNVGDDLPSAARVAGQIIFGNFSQVDVTDGGRVLAYIAPKAE